MHNNIFSKFKTINISLDSTIFNYLVLLCFFSIVNVGIFHHEMWRDELEAWLIAKDSISIPDLLNNLKYTGHPALWYICLHFISKVVKEPAIIQLFNAILITGAILVFLYHSPFSKIQKALFCFGYFPLYEYGVISRSYSLGLLLIFSFCTLFCRSKHNYLYLAITLALLSHIHIYGLMIGFVFASMLAWTTLIKFRHEKKTPLKQPNLFRQIGISLAVYLLSLLGAIAQIAPPVNANNNAGDIANSVSKSYNLIDVFLASERPLTGIWRSYVPIGNLSLDDFWNSNFLADNNSFFNIAGFELGSVISVILSSILCLSFALVFIKNRKILFTYIAGTFSIVMFGILFKSPDVRHSGHLFILLVACLWIYLSEAKSKTENVLHHRSIAPIPRYQNMLLTTILCLQVYAGIQMYAVDSANVFSNSQNVAWYIKRNQLENSTIIGSNHRIVFPIAAWLNKEIYYPETQQFGSFTVWTPKSKKLNRDIGLEEIIQAKNKLERNNYDNLLLVLDWKIPDAELKEKIELLTSYEDAMVTRENYFLYSID